ncbi:MAG: hypothetical protein OXN17_22460 [Candidatus Poribacteria bacterium]|nr:hypothetical protein [Candidatus Poribacteria bacterium]MDE0505318.1 hypothetical protein [Candidatus Poribacteria bacterium]
MRSRFLIRAIRVICLIRDSEMIRHKHQIKHIDNPVSIHIALTLIHSKAARSVESGMSTTYANATLLKTI